MNYFDLFFYKHPAGLIDNILGLITEIVIPVAGILLIIYLIKQLKKK